MFSRKNAKTQANGRHARDGSDDRAELRGHRAQLLHIVGFFLTRNNQPSFDALTVLHSCDRLVYGVAT